VQYRECGGVQVVMNDAVLVFTGVDRKVQKIISCDSQNLNRAPLEYSALLVYEHPELF
jgi:hypothetical protein